MSSVWAPRPRPLMAKEEPWCWEGKASSGQGWAACQQMSQLLSCLSSSLLHSPKHASPTPHPATEPPDGLSNFMLLFLWRRRGGGASFSLPSGEFIHCSFWLLAFCSVNICLRGEESVFIFEAKEEVTYEMRADPLILWSEFLPDILKLLTLTPAVCCP